MENNLQPTAFPGLVDLASERVGGKALIASDEFFAEKENLLKPGRGVFIPDKFTDRGKWMDGWESRRKRVAGYDWCIIKLGLSGVIKGVDIDTNHFLGNHPPFASMDACVADGPVSPTVLVNDTSRWSEILLKSPLNPGSQNMFPLSSPQRWTHVRLNIYPDGGVARLRVYGDVVPDWGRYKTGDLIDLAAIQNGGTVAGTSDMFFGAGQNILMPERADNMGDGWETKRRRGPGYDWLVVKLGKPGSVKKIEVDTNHFKGNYPDECSIEGCRSEDPVSAQTVWTEILPRTKLAAHSRHFFEKELIAVGTCTHVRLNIYPDGGVSRLRVMGVLEK